MRQNYLNKVVETAYKKMDQNVQIVGDLFQRQMGTDLPFHKKLTPTDQHGILMQMLDPATSPEDQQKLQDIIHYQFKLQSPEGVMDGGTADSNITGQ